MDTLYSGCGPPLGLSVNVCNCYNSQQSVLSIVTNCSHPEIDATFSPPVINACVEGILWAAVPLTTVPEMSNNFISFIYALILPVSIEHVSFISSYQPTRPAEDTESREKMKGWRLSCTRWKDIWWHVKNNILTEKEGTFLVWITHPPSVWLLILRFGLPTIPTYGTYSHEKTDFKETSQWNRTFLSSEVFAVGWEEFGCALL